MYVILAILNEKIEELFQYFKESQDIFVYTAQFYQNSSNKKISELAREILSILNGIKKQQNTLILNKEVTSNLNSQFKKFTLEDTNSNSDKNSSQSGDNKDKQPKFSFIKKKAPNEAESEKKVEIENLLTSVEEDNKTEITNDSYIVRNKTIPIDEKQTNSSTSKFSFIKSKVQKKPEIPADIVFNSNQQVIVSQGNIKNNFSNLLPIRFEYT